MRLYLRVMVALPSRSPESQGPPRQETLAYVSDMLAELAGLARHACALEAAEAIEKAHFAAARAASQVGRDTNPPDSDRA